MRSFTSILAAISLFGLANATPEPTPKKLNAWDANGWTPAPTGVAEGALAGYKHPALFKRQATSDMSVCGYLDGQADEAITCSSGHWCGYDTVDQWFGCCLTTTVSGTKTRPAGCPIITDCVDSASLAQCTGACASDSYIRKCTNAASPYCGALTFGDVSMTNYICDSTPGIYQLFLTPTDAGGSTGVFQTSTGGGFAGTGTTVGGGSGATSTFNLGSSSKTTKTNVQSTSTSDSSPSTTNASTSTTAPIKTVTVANTTPVSTQSKALAVPMGVYGGLEVVGAAVMAVVGLF